MCSSDLHAALEKAVADLADCGPPDAIAGDANRTWSGKMITKLLEARFPAQSPGTLKISAALGNCPGAGALTEVVLALEELKRAGRQRALVAALGWNQQAAAAVVERAGAQP